MKTALLYLVAAIATTLASRGIVLAQGIPFASSTDLNRLVSSSEARDTADPIKFCGDDNSACCCDLPRFAVSASLLYLQPGSGSLEYGTLVSPLPAPSPHWDNQSIRPGFSPAFNVGVRYFVPDNCNDIRSSWTHLDSTASASFVGGPLQFAGPSYLIGPGATAYNLGSGSVHFRYDAVNLTAGHLWRAGQSFQMRVFGGVQFGSITQNLTGSFSDFGGANTQTNTTNSKFTGAGPRLGVDAQFNLRNFQFFGDMAAVALVGSQHSGMNFNTTSALFPAGNPQSFTSPNATQIVPGLDTRLGGSYSFPLGKGICKIEAGYQAVVYVSAINSYTLTQVATPPVVGGVGVFFATAEHLQNNFTAQGPYLSGIWSF
jgi:hypothetical protein